MSKPVVINGIAYPSQAAAARAMGITKQAINNRKGMPGNASIRRAKKRSGNTAQARSGQTPARRLTDDERIALCNDLISGMSMNTVAKKHNVTYHTAQYWKEKIK